MMKPVGRRSFWAIVRALIGEPSARRPRTRVRDLTKAPVPSGERASCTQDNRASWEGEMLTASNSLLFARECSDLAVAVGGAAFGHGFGIGQRSDYDVDRCDCRKPDFSAIAFTVKRKQVPIGDFITRWSLILPGGQSTDPRHGRDTAVGGRRLSTLMLERGDSGRRQVWVAD